MSIITLNLIAELSEQIPNELCVGDQFHELCETLRRLGISTLDIDIDEQLAKRGEIADRWCIDDVLDCCPKLSRRQAWRVLRFIRDNHDASIGINNESFDVVADLLFPEVLESESKEA